VPVRSELASIAERMAQVRLLRVGLASIVLVVGVLAPDVRGVSLGALSLATGLYLILVFVPSLTARLSRSKLLPVIAATLLVDGIYLAWVTYATGGTQSPFRLLVYVHVVAVTLLTSYGTGLKIAAWHSILMLVTFYAQSAGILVVRETLVSALPGRGGDFRLVSMLNVGAVWAVALATAAFSAANERELRAQKIDLEQLSLMVAEIDERSAADEIPEILLAKLSDVFGFTRGVVLAARPKEEMLTLAAYRGPGGMPTLSDDMDPVVERAWISRETQLVGRLDHSSHPQLTSLLPGGRNVLVVPMFVDRAYRLGILLLEYPAKTDTIKLWVIAIVEQFAKHAALALHNAWLLEENQVRLEENRVLQSELIGQNVALEARVQERTAELRDSLEDLRMVDMQRRKLLSRLVNAEEEERRRIAGDIHDGPIQQLIAAGLQLEVLRATLAGGNSSADPVEYMEDVMAALSGAVGGMRSLIFELRPTALDEEGLVSALLQFVQGLDPELQVKIRNELSDEPPAETRITLYRIAQEALVNIRKHAEAKSVEILMKEQDGGYLARISDDGVGFSPPGLLQSSPGHLGLSSMRERAEMAGGRCEVRSHPDAGTTVEFWLPVHAQKRRIPSRPRAMDGLRSGAAPARDSAIGLDEARVAYGAGGASNRS
jgi:signal transduction histidine kinase